LVYAAVEGEGPTAVENAPLDRDFKFGSGAVLGGGLGAELLVPVSAELRAQMPWGPPELSRGPRVKSENSPTLRRAVRASREKSMGLSRNTRLARKENGKFGAGERGEINGGTPG
jgi:uncharacterized membrane protein